jgi:hypothetical protein
LCKKEIWLWQLCFKNLLKLHFNPCIVTPVHFFVSLLYSCIPWLMTKYMYCTVYLLFHFYCIKMGIGPVWWLLNVDFFLKIISKMQI